MIALVLTVGFLLNGCTAEQFKYRASQIAYDTALSYDCAKNQGPDVDSHRERCSVPAWGGKRPSYEDYRETREERLAEPRLAQDDESQTFEIEETVME